MSKNNKKNHDERINEVINEMVAEKAAERREKEMAAENEIKEQVNEEVTAVVEKPGFIGFMKNNKKKIIGGVLLTAGVVGAYFLYKAMTNGNELPVVDGDLTVDPDIVDVDVPPFEEASAVVEA